MPAIKITNRDDTYTLVDDDWYELLQDKKISLNANGYPQLRWDKKTTSLHRLVSGAATGQEVNHKDRDKLNNQYDNLEFVTHRENMIHRTLLDRKFYRGVSLHRFSNKNIYRARYRHDKRFIQKLFGNEIDAALQWNDWMRELYGDDFKFYNPVWRVESKIKIIITK